jgi:hypothetical protein
MTTTSIESKPEDVMFRVLGTTGFALGLLLAISAFVM